MPRRIALYLLALLAVGPLLAASQEKQRPEVWELHIDGAIGPASADYLGRALGKAREAGVELVVLTMDTPGGLDSAMRDMVKDILASPVPVATYVYPAGARAASAGTYILYASHVAAMAPGTNLGAATPVKLGGLPGLEPPETPGKKGDEGQSKDKESKSTDTMTRKMVNDAAAYLRSLADLRGRSAQWAEEAVRESASLPAQEALSKGVIDVVAGDVPDLLRQINGRTVRVLGEERVLHTGDAVVTARDPDWRSELLAVITDPNVAYILMLVGIYGLIFELANPGFVLPGVAGAIALLLALYAFQVLPVNYAGLGLMMLGVAFMVAELFAPSFGALGIGGVIAFVAGSVMLMDTEATGYTIAWPLIGAVTLTTAGFFLGVLGMLARFHRRRAVTGREELVGASGTVSSSADGRLRVRVHGELWGASSTSPLRAGQTVRVTALKGLTLQVEPAPDPSNQGG